MDEARPLRDVFADLATDEDARRAHAADPEGFLHAQGHAELPSQLVGEAIVNYADTAPPEIAEHLAPFVMAHSPIPVEDGPLAGADPTDGLHLLATAPADPFLDVLPADLDGSHLDGPQVEAGHLDAGHLDADQHAPADPFDLAFGHGDQPDEMHHGGTSDVDGGHGLGGQLGAHQDESHIDDILAGHDAGALLPDPDPAGTGPGHDTGQLDGHDSGHDAHDAHGWLADGHDLAEHPAAPPEDLTDL